MLNRKALLHNFCVLKRYFIYAEVYLCNKAFLFGTTLANTHIHVAKDDTIQHYVHYVT